MDFQPGKGLKFMRPVAALSEIHDVSQPISRQADLLAPGFVATIPPLADPKARRDITIARQVRLARRFGGLRGCGRGNRWPARENLKPHLDREAGRERGEPRMVKSLKFRRRLAACLVLVAPSLCAGCVERRYTLRTEPPGALAIVNGEEIGPTPVSRSFTYYGDREITFLLDGYETKTVIQPIKAPWWDNLVTEFFTENIVPFTLRDEREFKYELTPAPAASSRRPRRIVPSSCAAESRVLPKPRRGGILGWLGFSDPRPPI